MEVVITLPRDWEVKSVDLDSNRISIQPRFIRNQKLSNILFATVSGDSGRTKRTIISVSGVTGALHVTAIKEAEDSTAFDKSPQDSEQTAVTRTRRTVAKPPSSPAANGGGEDH